jgi:hypothetical protein
MIGLYPGDRGCDCECHHTDAVRHCVPCCDGPCKYCGYRATRGRGVLHEKKCKEYYDAHVLAIQRRRDEQLKENT